MSRQIHINMHIRNSIISKLGDRLNLLMMEEQIPAEESSAMDLYAVAHFITQVAVQAHDKELLEYARKVKDAAHSALMVPAEEAK